MFTYQQDLRSGKGTVSYHREGDMLVAVAWFAETDESTAIESVTFEGREDYFAAQEDMRRFIDMFAASN